MWTLVEGLAFNVAGAELVGQPRRSASREPHRPPATGLPSTMRGSAWTRSLRSRPRTRSAPVLQDAARRSQVCNRDVQDDLLVCRSRPLRHPAYGCCAAGPPPKKRQPYLPSASPMRRDWCPPGDVDSLQVLVHWMVTPRRAGRRNSGSHPPPEVRVRHASRLTGRRDHAQRQSRATAATRERRTLPATTRTSAARSAVHHLVSAAAHDRGRWVEWHVGRTDQR